MQEYQNPPDYIATLKKALQQADRDRHTAVATLTAVTHAWGTSLDLLQRLVQDVCVASGPGGMDRDVVDHGDLYVLCRDVEAHLAMYRGQV